jgi:hypothetical protein
MIADVRRFVIMEPVARIVPTSPRVRRRLLGVVAVLVAAGAAALVVVLLPNDKGGIASSSQTGTVQVVRRQRQIRVTPEMRRSIDALFDRFVPLAVARRDPGSVKALVTPHLWRQATPAEWRAGTIPVPPYDPAGSTFHGWRTIYAVPRDVSIELTLEPRRRRDPAGSFVVGLKQVGARWLVDSIYVEGTHGGESAAPPSTTGAATTTERVIGGSRGRLGAVWILVPLCLLSLIVIIPFVVFTRQWWNDRRVRRRHRADQPKELPPLPRPPGTPRNDPD